MPAEVVDAIPVRVEHKRDQQAEFSVAEHRDGLAARNRDLIENLARRRQRLREDRAIERDIVRRMEVRLGQDEVFGKRAGLIDNAEDRSARAVPAETLPAPVAILAAQVDLADD